LTDGHSVRVELYYKHESSSIYVDRVGDYDTAVLAEANAVEDARAILRAAL
jgi:hypothetical protein